MVYLKGDISFCPFLTIHKKCPHIKCDFDLAASAVWANRPTQFAAVGLWLLSLCFLVFLLLTQVEPVDRSRCRLGADSSGPKEPRIRWGSRSHHRKGQFWGVVPGISAHWKPSKYLVRYMRQRGHSVLSRPNNCNVSDWSVSYYIVPLKKSTPAIWHFAKILSPLVNCTLTAL